MRLRTKHRIHSPMTGLTYVREMFIPRKAIGSGLAAITIFTLVQVSPAFSAPSVPTVVDPVLELYLQRSSPSSQVPVFLHASDSRSARQAGEAAGLLIRAEFVAFDAAYGVGTPSQIAHAIADGQLVYVEADKPITLLTNSSHAATRGEQAVATFTDPSGRVLDGTGTSIAIVDSGIDGSHPAFEGRVVRNVKLLCQETPPIYATTQDGEQVPPSTCPEDSSTDRVGDTPDALFVDMTAVNQTDTISAGGHGTHVAGIAAMGSAHSGGYYRGAAPGAKLVGVSIGTSISIYGGVAGLEWVLRHHRAPCGSAASASECPPIRVVNNSWAVTTVDDDGTSHGVEYNPNGIIEKASDQLARDGVTVVWAAGNSGGDGSRLETNGPGASPVPGVLMVADYDDRNRGGRDYALATSSARGLAIDPASFPDVSAPGTNIASACSHTLTICRLFGGDLTDPHYNSISGTSMAAPHVAGVVAVLLQADPLAGTDDALMPGDIEKVLQDTAHKFIAGAAYEPDPRNPGSTTSYDKGHGLVDVAAAVAAVQSRVSPEPGAPCTDDAVQLPDRRTDTLGTDVNQAAQRSLDLVAGHLSWEPGTQTLVFHIRVEDLTAGPAAGSVADQYDLSFAHHGVPYTIRVSRSLLETRGALYRGSEVTESALLAPDFDFPTSTIKVPLAASTFNAVFQPSPQLEFGTLIEVKELVARRQFVAGTVRVDSAAARCDYTVGQELPEPPVPQATTLVVTASPTGKGRERGTHVTAVLTETAGGSPIPERWITFYVDDMNVGADSSDSTGTAEVVIAPVNLKRSVVTAKFAGDTEFAATAGTVPTEPDRP